MFFVSPAVFLATFIGTLILSASSVINNTYEQDIGRIFLLALVGYVLTIVCVPFMEQKRPGDRRSSKRASRLFQGLIVKSVDLVVVALICSAVVAVVSLMFGAIYAIPRGEDIIRATVQFFRVFGWVGAGVTVLILGESLSYHWDHLLRFIEYGSRCNVFHRREQLDR